jgi:hypothetical protein
MGVTTHDIFGAVLGARSAAGGTYREPPSEYRLPKATALGRVRLVANLERSLAFYEKRSRISFLRAVRPVFKCLTSLSLFHRI